MKTTIPNEVFAIIPIHHLSLLEEGLDTNNYTTRTPPRLPNALLRFPPDSNTSMIKSRNLKSGKRLVMGLEVPFVGVLIIYKYLSRFSLIQFLLYYKTQPASVCNVLVLCLAQRHRSLDCLKVHFNIGKYTLDWEPEIKCPRLMSTDSVNSVPLLMIKISYCIKGIQTRKRAYIPNMATLSLSHLVSPSIRKSERSKYLSMLCYTWRISWTYNYFTVLHILFHRG